jgi:hypothetical protein
MRPGTPGHYCVLYAEAGIPGADGQVPSRRYEHLQERICHGPQQMLRLNNKVNRYWPTDLQRISFEDLHQGSLFAAFVPLVASRYVPIHSITCGLNSRARPSTFRHYGVPCQGGTWFSNNQDAADKVVISEIFLPFSSSTAISTQRNFPPPTRVLWLAAAAAISTGTRGLNSKTQTESRVFPPLLHDW